jgi:uncharacterized protein YjbI with pentapeptide repeats
MAKRATQAGPLAGKRLTLVGNFGYRDYFRPRYEAAIAAAGGSLVGAGSAAPDYIVAGEGRGGKPPSAVAQLHKKHPSARVIDLAELCRLLLPSPDELAAGLRSGPRDHEYWEDVSLFSHSGNVTISLDGFDLRGADLFGAKLERVGLDAADLRKSSAHYAHFGDLSGTRFDGADLTNAYVRNAHGCSFRKADMTEVWLGWGGADTYTDCDFTGAKLPQGRAEGCRFMGSAFDGADLSDAELEESDFLGVSLAGADLSRAHGSRAGFDRANLAGAILYRADLRGATLNNADLRGADLREAVLSGADLSGARVDGANLAGAVLEGAKAVGVDFSSAKNYQPPVTRVAGPKVQELAQAAANGNKFVTSAEVELGKGEHSKLAVWCDFRGSSRYVQARSDYRRDDNEAIDLIPAPTFEQGMLNLAARWPQATLRLDTVTARGSRTVRGKKLLELATAAWAEAFALGVTAPEDLNAQKAAQQADLARLRETMLEELRGGPAGVKKWNAHSKHERERIGPLNGLDLKGLDLAGVELSNCDLRDSRFDGANLRKASLWSSQLEGASFARADLTEAGLSSVHAAGVSFQGARLAGCRLFLAELHGANFRGADLAAAELRSASLQGADLTGARLDRVDFQRASYDAETKFPRGFIPPASMERIAAPPPLVAAAPGSMDFKTFFEQLGAKVDPTKLDNALRMLKAERFQLFADVTDEGLVGVVRSQTSSQRVYSCRLTADGSYGCGTQNLRACGGLHGALCKHLLVLVVGLARAGQLDPATVDAWVNASKKKKPAFDWGTMSETFLRYKGAEAGEIDWRPTETLPEDYYAL